MYTSGQDTQSTTSAALRTRALPDAMFINPK